MSCPSPHPTRAPSWRDTLEDLEVIGSYSTDSWVRCRKCGKWFWLTSDDSSKWQYYDEWEVDKTLAERALLNHDTGAVAELLVSNDLPWGPIWTAQAALVEILRALTPSATDAERRRALDAAIAKGQPPLRGTGGNRWLAAAKLLGEIATHDVPAAPDLRFAVDVTLQGCAFDQAHEIGSSLVLFQTAPSHVMMRIDAKAISQLPIGGAMRYLARNDDVVLFGVTTTDDAEAVCRVDRAGAIATFPASSTRYVIRNLDDGFWLFVPDDGTSIRHVELHEPDGRSKATMSMALDPQTSHACPPRRMGDGWVFSGCIDAEGTEHTLTLVDASFKAIAQSTMGRGQRLVVPIDGQSLWCETVKYPFVLERWERRGSALERTLEIESQSWIHSTGGIVVKPRKFDGGLVGYGDDGKQRFHLEHETRGATYLAEVPGGLLVYNDARAETIDPRTGNPVAPTLEIEAAHLFTARDGTSYLQERAFLWVLGQERKRVFVGEERRLETTCGSDALLRDERGECLLVGSDGSLRGRFSAPDAQFSVVGTRGGPYVIEGSRVRIASFG